MDPVLGAEELGARPRSQGLAILGVCRCCLPVDCNTSQLKHSSSAAELEASAAW